MELFLGVHQIEDAKRIKAELSKHEISVEMTFNDQTCTKGCQITVELWGHEEDKEIISNFFEKEFQKNIEGLDINPELLKEVYDPNAESATCQACGFKFAPNLNECPDCGLVYG